MKSEYGQKGPSVSGEEHKWVLVFGLFGKYIEWYLQIALLQQYCVLFYVQISIWTKGVSIQSCLVQDFLKEVCLQRNSGGAVRLWYEHLVKQPRSLFVY